MRVPMPKAPARGRSTTIAGDSKERAGYACAAFARSAVPKERSEAELRCG